MRSNWTDDLGVTLLDGGREGDVPSLEGSHGQRKPHDPVAEEVEPRRLGVEAELFAVHQPVDHLLQLLGAFHDRIGVGGGEDRVAGFARLLDG